MKKMFATFTIILIAILIIIYYLSDKEKNVLDAEERVKLGGSYISLSDGITHYKLSGPIDGQLVVFIHGGIVPMWIWDNQVEALNKAGYKVLIYDQHGRGYSDRPKAVYNQELYKRQLIELVDKLGIDNQFNLVGLSLGGGTAVNFSAQYPNRIRKLVLISPLINNYKVPSIFKVPIIGEFVARLFGSKIISHQRFASLFEGNPDANKYKMLFEVQTTYKGFQRSLLSMLRNDAVGDYTISYEILGKQERQILLIWGTKDKEITQEMIAEIKGLLPNLRFEQINDVGHGIVFQKPEVINSFLLDFIR